MPHNSKEELREKQYIAIERYKFGGNREAAIQRDGERCVKCGMTRFTHRIKYGKDITVDHIDGLGVSVKAGLKNNNLDNLQTLCLSCHAKKDMRRRKRPMLSEVDVINIRHCKGAVNGMDLAKIYGIQHSTIYKIWNRRTWSWI